MYTLHIDRARTPSWQRSRNLRTQSWSGGNHQDTAIACRNERNDHQTMKKTLKIKRPITQDNRPYSHKLPTIIKYVNCPSNFAFARSIYLFHPLIFEKILMRIRSRTSEEPAAVCISNYTVERKTFVDRAQRTFRGSWSVCTCKHARGNISRAQISWLQSNPRKLCSAKIWRYIRTWQSDYSKEFEHQRFLLVTEGSSLIVTALQKTHKK